MGAIVFDNFVFDSWLTKKSDEILSKVDREKISNEDMLILILKAQTNHFHHMDVEFRDEFGIINQRYEKIDERFDKMETKIDQRFEKVWNFHKWQMGLLITLFAGLYLKLFFG